MRKLIKEFFKENRINITIHLIFIIINMYLLTYPSLIVGDIIDLLYDIEKNRVEIINNVFLLMGLSVLLLIIRLIWKYFDTLIPRSLEKILKNNLFEHLLKMKIVDIQKIKNGEIMSYFVKDIGELRITCHHIFSFLPRIIFVFIFVTYSMVKNVNLYLTIISLSPLVIAAMILIKIKEKINLSYKKSQQNFSKLSEFLQESTDSIRTTKAYHLEDNQINTFISLNDNVKSSNIKVNLYSTLLSVSMHICFGLVYGISLLWGGKLVLSNQISVGDFVAFNSFIALFIHPVAWIPSVVSRIKRGQVSYRRIDEMLKIEEEKINYIEEEGNEKSGLDGDIIIKDLSFSYKGFIDEVLNNINLEIKKGETIGIIGKVGSGKTTLMNLLVKLYQVSRDKIYINNIDINDIPIVKLRENICYITQDNFLFSTSIKQNISLFRKVKDEDVKSSLKESMIYDDVENMEYGIETIIGERGVDLSGGQKQRVVISRAFLNKSNIVIFDDTFSALDNKTEQHLLKNIKKLTDGKTCFIISNRISDLKHADKIVVMDAGEIIEVGTHKTLMNSKGAYYTFYKEQAIKKEDSMLS